MIDLRLLHGGSWFFHPWFCRSAFRDHLRPGNTDSFVGFRVVCLHQGSHTIRLEGQADD